MSSYVFSVQSPKGFESTVQAVTSALKQEGFGVLTTIDVQATLKAKLGVEQRPYVILGAATPISRTRSCRPIRTSAPCFPAM